MGLAPRSKTKKQAKDALKHLLTALDQKPLLLTDINALNTVKAYFLERTHRDDKKRIE